MLHSMYLLFLIFASNLSFSRGVTCSMSYSSSSSSASSSSSYDYVRRVSYTDEEEVVKKRKQEEAELLRKQKELEEQQQRIQLEEEQQRIKLEQEKLEKEQQRIKLEQEKNLCLEQNERMRLKQEQEEEFKKFEQELLRLQKEEELRIEQKRRDLELFKQGLYSDTESLIIQSLINIANKVISEEKYVNLVKKIVQKSCLNEILAHDIEIHHLLKENNVRLQQDEQDFIRIKETWQKLQQEDHDAKDLKSEQLKESILQSSAYRSFFISFGKDPDDEDDDDEPVLLILGPFIQSNQHVRTGIKDGLSIYVPVNQGPQVCIYVPGQAGYPPLIYVPAKFDNPPCIYVPTQEEAKNLILHCDPTFGIGSGALIGGGIVSGGTIPIIIGGGLAVGWIVKEGVPLLKGVIDKIKQHREEKKGGGGGGGGNNNNDDDKDKDKNKNKPFDNQNNKNEKGKNQPFNETYESNPKHHPNSKGDVGKSPKNPKETLRDKSIEVPGEKHRVAIEDGKFVIFKPHAPGKWHGYIVEKFKQLDEASKKALYNAGLVRDITKGKIKK